MLYKHHPCSMLKDLRLERMDNIVFSCDSRERADMHTRPRLRTMTLPYEHHIAVTS